ncbi:MAG: hypothetical protein ACYTGP_13110, partial [Planctomycetota bacterium]
MECASREISRSCLFLRLSLAALVVFGAVSCAPDRVLQPGMTGIEVTVTFDASLGLDEMEVRGFRVGGAPAFEAGTLPDPRRPLASGQETFVVLIDPA